MVEGKPDLRRHVDEGAVALVLVEMVRFEVAACRIEIDVAVGVVVGGCQPARELLAEGSLRVHDAELPVEARPLPHLGESALGRRYGGRRGCRGNGRDRIDAVRTAAARGKHGEGRYNEDPAHRDASPHRYNKPIL